MGCSIIRRQPRLRWDNRQDYKSRQTDFQYVTPGDNSFCLSKSRTGVLNRHDERDPTSANAAIREIIAGEHTKVPAPLRIGIPQVGSIWVSLVLGRY